MRLKTHLPGAWRWIGPRFLGLLASYALAAASLAANLEHPRIDRLSVDDGLPHGTVYSVTQDGVGFIWFGTEDGLNRYDGHTFRIYKCDLEDQRVVTEAQIRLMAEQFSPAPQVGFMETSAKANINVMNRACRARSATVPARRVRRLSYTAARSTSPTTTASSMSCCPFSRATPTRSCRASNGRWPERPKSSSSSKSSERSLQCVTTKGMSRRALCS